MGQRFSLLRDLPDTNTLTIAHSKCALFPDNMKNFPDNMENFPDNTEKFTLVCFSQLCNVQGSVK